jgi:two-component system chemotaxis response regulator CheY
MANNLLLVDESPLIQRVVELTLEGKDVSIHSAEDADEALSLARSLKPDIILASTEFKGGGGLDFCRTLQGDADLAGTPVLLLASAKEGLSDEEAKEAGAAGVLTKPFEPENLLAEVGKVLSWSDGPGEAPAGEAEDAEAEITGLQAEIAAEFEGAEGEAQSELENLADDQVRAAEEELASLQEELETEIDTTELTGEPLAGDEGLFEEVAFLETGTLKEAEAAVPGESAEGELNRQDDDAFWENLEIEAGGDEALPDSPEIYAVPHEGGSAESAPGEDAFLEAVLTSPLLGEAAGEDGGEDFSKNILSPEGDLLDDEVAPLVESSLERTVEAIVPAILRRIESLVVEQLPGMVEKIVLREIEKIKRGE